MNIRAFLLPAAVLGWSLLGPSVGAQDPFDALDAGRQLSEEDAAALEVQLAEEPERQDLRVQLIGFYGGLAWGSEPWRRRTVHILWLIRNQPGAKVLAAPEGEIWQHLEPDSHCEARAAWVQYLQGLPMDLGLLRNAAAFFRFSDRERAIELLERAQELDPPNPEWSMGLGHLYSLEMVGYGGELNPAAASQALTQFEQAYQLLGMAEGGYLLKDLASAAFAAGETGKAREYAEQMLVAIVDDWDYGNRVHHGHLILGRIALGEGNLSEAKDRLLRSGQTPGSPQLNSFGPNMALANDLLHCGETEVVLEYFELCSQFWDTDELADWTVLVAGGRTPDFGANLSY